MAPQLSYDFWRILAPELLAGEETFRTSPASDISSLSMTFLNVWTRKLLFFGLLGARKVGAATAAGGPSTPTIQIDLTPEMGARILGVLGDIWAHEVARRPSNEDVQK